MENHTQLGPMQKYYKRSGSDQVSGGQQANSMVPVKTPTANQWNTPPVPTQNNGVTARVVPTSTLPKNSKPSSKRPLIISLVVAAIILIASLGFGVSKLRAKANVGVFQVGAQQTVNEFAGGGGITYPRQQLDVSYPVSERVTAVHVKAGDVVKVNQPLLQLDPTQINAQINQAAGDVAAAQAYLNSVSASGNAVTIAQAQQAYQQAQDRYNSLVAQASSPTLNKGNIISPMDGTVVAVNINANEVFAANTILLTIMDESSAIVHAKIPLSSLNQIHIGLPVSVVPSALPDLSLPGTVSSIIAQADPQTDTFEVDVEVKNPQQKLLPGMSAFVRVQGQGQAFSVPRAAVLNPDHDATVFFVRDDTAYMQRVHVVGRSADRIFIDTGVSSGTIVVIVGIDQLQDGQPVNVSTTER